MTTIQVMHGDCLDILPMLSGLDACVCDPPYHLTSIVDRFGAENAAPAQSGKDGAYARASRGFMGKQWDGGDVALRPETWRLVLNALKPGAHLVAFGGTRTFHRMACAIEDAGFEIRDTLCWLYGAGFPKSHNVSKGIDKAAGVEREALSNGAPVRRMIPGSDQQKHGWIKDDGREFVPTVTAPVTPEAQRWQGWGTALKPAIEMIVLARKPLSEKTVAANVLRHGTGAINIDACRIQVNGQQRPDAIIPTWASDQNLCASCVEHVANSRKPETLGTKASTATSSAAPTSSARGESAQPDTSKAAIGCCDGMSAVDTLGSSSIGASGKMQTDLSLTDTISTTSTATNSTTDLRTCSACGVTITHKNTPYIRRAQNGSPPMQQGQGSTAPQGRWPSNCLHDGSEEVEAAFAAFGERPGAVSNGRKGVKGVFEDGLGAMEQAPGYTDSGSASRFFYSAKANADDRAGSKHPTVKPLALMRWLVRLITPPGGTVLDCFAGSGTTGEAARLGGFNAVLIEREAKYVADIHKRLGRASGADTPLFAGIV